MPEPHFEPNACRWCGVPQRGHFQLWKPPVGWHTFAEPTDEQRLARMKARRAAREPQPAQLPTDFPTGASIWIPGDGNPAT